MKTQPIVEAIWKGKYRYSEVDGTSSEKNPRDTAVRVVEGVYSKDPNLKEKARALELMANWSWCPGGRILAGAGTPKRVTLINCYVNPLMEDSMKGIMEGLTVSAYTQQQGGGVGIDFTPLRPVSAVVRTTGSVSTGPIPFMDMWDAMCATIKSSGCFPAGVLVLTEEGPLPIEVVVAGRGKKVWTKDGWRKITARFRNGRQFIRETFLSNGQKVRSTKGHKFVTLNRSTAEREMKSLDRMEVGDPLLVLSNKPAWGNKSKRDVKLAWLTGLYHADGSYVVRPGNRQPVLSICLSLEEHNRSTQGKLLEVLKEFHEGHVASKQRREELCVDVKLHSSALYKEMEERGLLKEGSASVRIPEEVWRGSDTLWAYLAGFHSGDGDQGPKKGVRWRTTSKGLAEDVQRALAFLGIPSHLSVEDREAHRPWKDVYAVVVSGETWTKRLAGGLQDHCAYPVFISGAENAFHPPAWVRQTVLGEEKLPNGRKLKNFGPQSQRLSINTLTKALGDLHEVNRAAYVMVQEWFEEEKEEEVYDLEVEGLHEYVADGLSVSNSRRGAMMATMADWHPDIFEFITVKRKAGRLTNFNMSVLVSDALMKAVEEDDDWVLGFGVPSTDRAKNLGVMTHEEFAEKVSPLWLAACKEWDKGQWYIYRRLKARELWDAILRNTYEYAEPGVLFIDRVNAQNNLAYVEKIWSCNPCGEEPLPPNGACDLGSVNLAVMVLDPFKPAAKLDYQRLRDTVAVGVRFLDNVLDVTKYPTKEQQEEALKKRRIGLGITGLGTMFQQLMVRYGSKESLEVIEDVMTEIRDQAYRTSVDLAKERGPFPVYTADFLEASFVKGLPKKIVTCMEKHGIRNGVLLTVAPTGTTSIYYGNISSGIEPTFSWKYFRKVLQPDNSMGEFKVEDYGWWAYKRAFNLLDSAEPKNLPNYMVTATELSVEEHLVVQAACQRFVDASISKTINCPAGMKYEEFQQVYAKAYQMGLKGCTTYRPSAVRGSVLSTTSGMVVQAKRPARLEGATYKVKWPHFSQAFYITINDQEQEGRRTPFEIFINSKSTQHQEWVQALTRTISAVFRKFDDPTFLVEELEEVHSASGGAFIEEYGFVPSIVAMIGKILAKHFRGIGLMEMPTSPVKEITESAMDFCPKCGKKTYIREESCGHCVSCLFSTCS